MRDICPRHHLTRPCHACDELPAEPVATPETVAAIRQAYGVQTGSRPAPPDRRRNRVTPAQTKHLDDTRTRADRWNR